MNSATLDLLLSLLRSVRIMLVEDDEVLGSFLKACLEREYVCQTEWYKDGFSAVVAVNKSEEQPDLVLLNLRLPGLDGVEVLKRVRTKWPHVPVVVITGYFDSDLMTRAMDVGVFSVHAKPFKLDAVADIFTAFRISVRTRDREIQAASCPAPELAAQAAC